MIIRKFAYNKIISKELYFKFSFSKKDFTILILTKLVFQKIKK